MKNIERADIRNMRSPCAGVVRGGCSLLHQLKHRRETDDRCDHDARKQGKAFSDRGREAVARLALRTHARFRVFLLYAL